MRHHRTTAFALLLLPACVTSKPVGADNDAAEKAAILTTIDHFFEAMAARDAPAFASTMTRDGMTYSQILREGRWNMRAEPNRQHVEGLGTSTRKFAETYWQPTVMQRGPIAVVWAPYRFRVDGVDSHHGVDTFQLLKIDGKWLIANSTWTVEPELAAELKPGEGVEIRPASLK